MKAQDLAENEEAFNDERRAVLPSRMVDAILCGRSKRRFNDVNVDEMNFA